MPRARGTAMSSRHPCQARGRPLYGNLLALSACETMRPSWRGTPVGNKLIENSSFMMTNTERKSISDASIAGIGGIKFDYDHLKSIHLITPLRNIISFMLVKKRVKCKKIIRTERLL